jgi:hypothetical protein
MEDLTQFLRNANAATYAGGAEPTISNDGIHAYDFTQGRWRFRDTYCYGDMAASGQTIVWRDDSPYWGMTYFDKFNPHDTIEETLAFLKASLLVVDNDPTFLPVRGPSVCDHKSGMRYENKPLGTLADFTGKECIVNTGRTLFQNRYSGGLLRTPE